MNKVIHCPCGFVIRAKDNEGLIALTRRHAKESHDMDVTAEEALAMAKPE